MTSSKIPRVCIHLTSSTNSTLCGRKCMKAMLTTQGPRTVHSRSLPTQEIKGYSKVWRNIIQVPADLRPVVLDEPSPVPTASVLNPSLKSGCGLMETIKTGLLKGSRRWPDSWSHFSVWFHLRELKIYLSVSIVLLYVHVLYTVDLHDHMAVS